MVLNKLYGACPICGKKLCRAKVGSLVEVVCSTCKKSVTVKVENGKVLSEIIEGLDVPFSAS